MPKLYIQSGFPYILQPPPPDLCIRTISLKYHKHFNQKTQFRPDIFLNLLWGKAHCQVPCVRILCGKGAKWQILSKEPIWPMRS